MHFLWGVARACRIASVGIVWCAVIPWAIRWVWRWLFWIADAAWAREAFIKQMKKESLRPHRNEAGSMESIANTVTRLFDADFLDISEPRAYTFAQMLMEKLGIVQSNTTSKSSPSFSWPQADPSMLSSWTSLASLTSNDQVNRILLDIQEGLIITLVVITGFILVFLIREWVVQQQPLVNLDNLGNMQQQLRDAAERVQADNERFRRQQELLEQARRRLVELQNEAERYDAETERAQASSVKFVGWEQLEYLIEHATEHLKSGSEADHAHFLLCATAVTEQIRAADSAGVSLDEFTDKVYKKLAGYSQAVRRDWEAVLVSEIDKTAKETKKPKARADGGSENAEYQLSDSDGQPEDSNAARRPPMPQREFSSRATQIQRLLVEAEGVLNEHHQMSNNFPGNESARSTDVGSGTDSGSDASTLSTESWQQVTTPSGPSSSVDELVDVSESFDPMPITNAGPDAKINIKVSGKGKMRPVPEPKIEKDMLEYDEMKKELEKEVSEEMRAEGDKQAVESVRQNASSSASQSNQSRVSSAVTSLNPDRPEPERQDGESFGDRVASVFREEFGLDEAEELENLRQAGLGPDGEPVPNHGQVEQPMQGHRGDAPPTLSRQMADWFWGDIQPTGAPEAGPVPNEERQRADDEHEPEQEAHFIPEQNGPPAIATAAPAEDVEAEPEQPHHDPEVVAAAQQAGLDAEAVGDAEDLEGIFELIGLQGPLLGLVQTSAFCLLLVSCTILGAVVAPYAWGKLVLSFLGSPVYFMVKMPLQIASFVADLVIDLTLVFCGWTTMLLLIIVRYVLSAAQPWMPLFSNVAFAQKVLNFATATATKSGARLADMFVTTESTEGLAMSWAFLGASVHAHASLRTIEDEIKAVLDYTGDVVTSIVETISSEPVGAIFKQALRLSKHVPVILAKLVAGVGLLRQYTQPLLDFVTNLRKGALTFSTPEVPMDPSLVYWDSTDRSLATMIGYAALAVIAAIYVAMDTPITRSESGRKTEKMIRDTLRQAGGVLKVILIISIEMLVFPLYCGLLLDLAFLPLFQGASVASRWAFAGRNPSTFCFVHWFVGTCYMFHFALFVGMCRKILRKGVLWFIRDPDDPTFHPVRDVLERNVATQLRKIAFSALVYGALVILCLGGVIWTIGHVFEGIFPIHWISTEPVLEFPMDLLLYNFATPLVIRIFKPSDAVNAMYAWWLRRCARVLRLSHFLFDDRRKDEEGYLVRKTWKSFVLLGKADKEQAIIDEDRRLTQTDELPDVYFQRDGKYVLTPCNDQYRPPKPGEAFLHADDNDVYIAGKDGKKNDHFAKVYVPPFFRLRVTLFMVCLWMFSAFTGLCATLVPLVFGRSLFALMLPEGMQVNDIYAYSVGAYILTGAMASALKSRKAAVYVCDKATKVNVTAWIAPTKRFAIKALKCAYVYGFWGIVLPSIFALLLQFYLILPLHTWAVSRLVASAIAELHNANSTTSAGNATNALSFLSQAAQQQQNQLPALADHTVHILQDYALGLLYVRLASRFVLAAPASRAAEAFRRITADGYLNPNVRLATRFFVLPVTLISAFVLLFPPLVVKLALTATHVLASDLLMDADSRTKLYRYSYPMAASCVLLICGVLELGKATSRWRARIRDEVYLVGERLHNFGEKKPPAGSKTVVRKER